MAQIGQALEYDPSELAVQYALLVENVYITKEQIMKLTGLRNRVVSKILSDLKNPSSTFYLLETKKPDERSRYYKTSTTYEHYIQNILILGLRAFASNLEAIPILIARLNQLRPLTESIGNVRDFLSFFYRIMNSYGLFVEICSRNITDLFQNPKFLITIEKELENAYFQEIPAAQLDLIPKNDSLKQIKKDWLRYLESFFVISSSLGKKRIESGQVIILHALNMENKALHQTQIMNMTGYSRGNVSEILSELVKASAVRVVKKGKDRKKYFELNVTISDLILAKYARIKNTYSQVNRIIENRFLKDLYQINADKDTKIYIEGFIAEINRLYKIAADHLAFLINFLKGKEIG
jgi:DNA-binding transcriptional regulator GbsR (MarR family)